MAQTTTSATPTPTAPPTAATRTVRASAYVWVVLFASSLVQTTASFGNQAISPLAPFLLPDLGLNKSQLGLVLTAFYVGGIAIMTAAGWASDRLGVRRMFLVGLLGCGAPLLLASQAPGLAVLMVAMLLAGLGNGVALPSTTRAIVDWFPARHRGLAMGIKQTGVALAGAIMSLVVPPLAGLLGWRGALASIGWFTIGAGLLAWLLYREQGEAHAGRGRGSMPAEGFRSLLRNRNLMLLSSTSLCLAAVQLSLVGFMVLFLKERLGYDATVAGRMLAITQVGGVVGRIGWGLVSDAFFGGRRKGEMVIITAGSAFSAFGLSLVGGGTPLWLLWALLLVIGLSAVGWNGISMTFVAELAGRRASATAAGLNLSFSYVGIIFGPPVFGLLVDASGSYAPAFVAAGCIGLVALGLVSQIRLQEVE